VLVALYDGRAVPKVIDFGIAKAIGQPLTERTLVTEFGAIIGKLEYMSPEQAEFNQLDIDTRSDIYSLGVLLYELLTGTTPLTREALREAALDEVVRRIREMEPPKPSTRLSQTKDRLASISAQRKLEPAHLTKLLRGDIDWIVMKALEKDRKRRYETVKDFFTDIVRHLNNETVQARPPTTAYVIAKFVRKHRAAVSVVAFFFLLVAGAAAISIRFAIQAKAERDRADQKAQAEAKARADLQVQSRRTIARGLAFESTLARQERSDPSGLVPIELAERAIRVTRDADGTHLEQAELALRLAVSDVPLLRSFEESNQVFSSCQWSPRGFSLVACSTDGGLFLWNAMEGTAIARKQLPAGANQVRWSPKDFLICVACQDGFLRFWNPTTGDIDSLRVHSGPVLSVEWHPDGAHLLVAKSDKTLAIWDARTKTNVWSLDLPKHLNRPIHGLRGASWAGEGSIYGKSIVFSSRTSQHGIIENTSSNGWRTFGPTNRQDTFVDWNNVTSLGNTAIAKPSRSGSQLIFYSRHHQDTLSLRQGWDHELPHTSIRVFDSSMGLREFIRDTKNGLVTSMSFNTSGDLLAICGNGQETLIVDPHAGETKRRLVGTEAGQTSVAWSADQQLLATTSNRGHVDVFRTGVTGLVRPAEELNVWMGRFNRTIGANLAVIIDAAGKAWLLDAVSGELTKTKLQGDFATTASGPSGTLAALVEDRSFALLSHWTNDYVIVRSSIPEGDPTPEEVVAYAFNPGGTMVLTSHAKRSPPTRRAVIINGKRVQAPPVAGGVAVLRAWPSLQQLRKLTETDDTVLCAEWNKRGDRIVLGELGGEGRIIGVIGEPVNVPLLTGSKLRDPIRWVEWSTDDQLVATCTLSGAIDVWQAVSGKRLHQWKSSLPTPRTTIAWHPRGPWLASADRTGVVSVKDALSGFELLRFTISGEIVTVGWFQDGQTIAAVLADGSIASIILGESLAPIEKLIQPK
jgi:WD40 repeat protein